MTGPSGWDPPDPSRADDLVRQEGLDVPTRSSPPPDAAPPVCPRHPDQVSYLRCQRCNRPTCPACQRPAPVGFHCVDCLAQSRSEAPRTRSPVGGVAAPGRPLATYVLIGLCAVGYVLQLAVPSFTVDLQYAPIVGRSEPWRMITAAFLHDQHQLMHILFNMLALWQVGQWLEPALGRARFLALYLVSALGGSTGYLLLAFPPQSVPEAYGSSWVTPTVGASGAVFGLFGALLVFLRHLGRPAGGLLVLLGINALLPLFYPNIAWEAHLGGFIVGAVMAGVLIALRARSRLRWQWPAVAALVAVLVALVVLKYATVDDGFIRSLLRW